MKIFSLMIALFFSIVGFASEIDRKTEFALAVIQENILTTDTTVLVEFTKIVMEENSETNASQSEEDWVAVQYYAKILENYFGGPLTIIHYIKYIDQEEIFNDLSGKTIIISLCKDENSSYYLPDIGFELPAKKALINKAREIKQLIINQKLTPTYANCH